MSSRGLATWIMVSAVLATPATPSRAQELRGLTVTPHRQSDQLRWRRPPDTSLGARAELFWINTSDQPWTLTAVSSITFDSKSPGQLIEQQLWAWHDTPSARLGAKVVVPPGGLMVWSFNSRGADWGIGSRHSVQFPTSSGQRGETSLDLSDPKVWLSATTFLGEPNAVEPDRLVVHIVNRSDSSWRPVACRLWLPKADSDSQVLQPREKLTDFTPFPLKTPIEPGGRGGLVLKTGRLPLGYAALEVWLSDGNNRSTILWTHLRVKHEVFDISGGWVSSEVGGRSTLTHVPFLKTLKRMHINTAHIGEVPGYTDAPDLYTHYPLKLFNKLEPTSRFETDSILPRVHGVEFLGEPQYGGGRPVPPQEVWNALLPYQRTRLATTLTNSEERVWRFYAGLSDYPHYDAYRVNAPAADAWGRYDRWKDGPVLWGAPLETIGDLTRSLRELSRPRPIAYWSQGAHDGWGRYWGRTRTSPTPDELRSQAYHALARRITSLYWFNLSLKSLLKFRDLIEPITRVNREIRLLDELLLEGDAFEDRRLTRDSRPDWDLASVVGPQGGWFFALDLDYVPNRQTRVFEFRPPRNAKLRFRLPSWLVEPAEVARVDADGVHDVAHQVEDGTLIINDDVSVVGIYLVARESGLRARLQNEHQKLLELEKSTGFDPAKNDENFISLKAIAQPSPS